MERKEVERLIEKVLSHADSGCYCCVDTITKDFYMEYKNEIDYTLDDLLQLASLYSGRFRVIEDEK